MLLSLSLTQTHTYAHIRTHIHQHYHLIAFPACLLHLLHCLWFHWAAEHISCHCTVLSALSHMRHQLCLLQPLCSDRHASAVLPLSDSHVTLPTVAISTHALEPEPRPSMWSGCFMICVCWDWCQIQDCTAEKRFICSQHDLEIIIFACVYVFPNCIFMSKICPLLFLSLQCLNNPIDMEPHPRSDIYPCKVIQVRDKLLQSSRSFNLHLRFLTKWTL